MKGMFANANFGDKFVTRGGQCALFLELIPYSNHAMLWVQDNVDQIYNADGTHNDCEEFDIVGIWEGGKE